MSFSGRSVAKNASVLMIAQLITWGLTLVLTIFLPRYLGAENVGKLQFANSMWAIVTVFVTLGMDKQMTKEIARNPESAVIMFGNTIIVRTVLHIFGSLALLLYMWLLRENYPIETVYVVLMIGISSLIWQYNSACQAVLQGLERMEFISIANVAGKVVNTLVCIAALLAGLGIYTVAAVAGVAALVTLGVELGALRRMIDLRSARINHYEALKLMRASFPYFMSGVFLVVYMQVDIVIISLLVDERAIGWYGAADQLFGTLLFIPTVFITAVFPPLSRMYAAAPDSVPRLMRKSWDLLILLAIPIGLGILVIADPLVVLLFGSEFANSGPILALMGIVLILTYQNILLGQFLNSTDRQKAWTVVVAISAIVSVPLDILLVPWCQQQFSNGAMGGALSFIVTEVLMSVSGIWLLPRKSLGWTNVRVALLGLVAGLVMVAAAWPARHLFIGLPVGIGALVYLIAIVILRVVPRDDWMIALNLGRELAQKLRRRPEYS